MNGGGLASEPTPGPRRITMVLQRVRLTLLVGVAAVVFCSQGAQAGSPPPLYLTFESNGSLTVTLANGAAVGNSAIPPGPYWITFTNDFAAERDTDHKWHISGPGIDIWTDLNCSDSTIEQYLETLHPSSTYTVQDDYHPASLRMVFRTAATGSSTSGSSSASPTTGSSGATVKNSDTVGSRTLLPYRGALVGAVTSAGKLTLLRKGKPVSSTSLKAGRYTITVVDRSAKAGFMLKKVKPSKEPFPVTGTAFVGKRSVRIQLGVGRWSFLSGANRPVGFFVFGGA